MSGLQINGFEIIEELGAGGMATVWKARQISLDRIVAIKVLHSRFASDPADVQRFLSEAQAAARLKHPGIVQVYDANFQGGIYYFVMEYIGGYTVGEWLRRKGVLPERDALLVAESVSMALGYAWDAESLIHCDIKPENIMVDLDGAVKVADLGLSRTLSLMHTSRFQDEIMGTPAYMAPEQIVGDEPLDFRADIYSLGAMLYHMLTGRMLFHGYPFEQVMEMQVTETVDDLLDLNPRVSKPVCWLVERMLAKAREGRHTDWKAVRMDLDRVKRRMLPQGSALPEGVSTVRRSRKRKRRDYVRGDSAAAGQQSSLKPALMVCALLAAVAAGAIWFVRREPPPVIIEKPVLPESSRAAVARPREDPSVLLAEAEAWEQQHPEQFKAARERYSLIATRYKGSSTGMAAERRILDLVSRKEKRIDGILDGLKREATLLEEAGRLREAAELYEAYVGPLASDTAGLRESLARDLREKALTATETLSAEAVFGATLDRIAEALYGGRMEEAENLVEGAMFDGSMSAFADALERVRAEVGAVAGMDERLLDDFRKRKGSETSVELRDQKRRVQIVDVVDDRVMAVEIRTAAGAISRKKLSFGMEDLSLRERLTRMGRNDEPGVAIAKGLMAVAAHSKSRARRYFRMTDPQLGERLVALMDGGQPSAKAASDAR